MKTIEKIEFHAGSRQELLPNFADDFPYIASWVELDRHIGRFVPWHWHRAVEIFYIESGAPECCTPGKKVRFPAGSGGMVNSNILHMSRALSRSEKNISLVHLLDPSLLAGEQGSRIEQKYITPLIAAPQIEIIPLFPENTSQRNILELIRQAFRIPENEFGCEIKLRRSLSEIWLMLLELCLPLPDQKGGSNKNNDKIKQMMVYVHEHYPEKFSISQLAASAFLSERECFRVFRQALHMTPVEYVRSYRLQAACQMLARGEESVTRIGQACGLGSSSYFGKIFREYAGCTPSQYRARWQDCDN